MTTNGNWASADLNGNWASIDSGLYSDAAEAAVIGGILAMPTMYERVAGILSADDFYMLRWRYVYQAMQALKNDGLPLDYLTVTDRLRIDGKLAEVTPAALTQSINETPTSVNTPAYAQLVKVLSGRRALLRFTDQLRKDATDSTIKLADVFAKAGQALMEVQSRSEIKPPFSLVRELNLFWDEIEQAIASPDAFSGIPTGYRELDQCLNGLRSGQLVIVGARPGMGKSAFLLSIAMNLIALKPTARVVLFSAEMKTREVIRRLVSAQTGIDLRQIINGQLSDSERRRFTEAMGKIGDYKLVINDTPQLTLDVVRAALTDYQMEHGEPDLVLVDYLQLMTVPGMRKGDRVNEVGEISRGLKIIAGDFNAPVIAASQLSRAVELRQNKRPQLSDLRESGSLEQDADIVMFLYRGDYYGDADAAPNGIEVSIAKHRNGEAAKEPFHLYFDKRITRVTNGKQISEEIR